MRTAFEPPARKRTVPGAGALLRELRQTGPAAVFILSGSPEQMRRVLEAKLRLDGIRWDAFTLKPSLENLLRGRLRFLRDQVSYKLTALLESRTRAAPDTREVLFGDDAEADAFIYSLYADLCAGRVDNETLMEVLRRARVYEEDIPHIVRVAARVPRSDAVRRIHIHLDRMSMPHQFDELGPRVVPFYNYFQPALVLLEGGFLDADAVLRVGAEIVIGKGFNPDALAASFADLARRRLIGPRSAGALVDAVAAMDTRGLGQAAEALRRFARAVERGAPDLDEPVPVGVPPIDYAALFARDRERAHAGKRRAMWRSG